MVEIFRPAEILLPRPGTDLTRWSVIACDQFTSQPEYWDQADEFVGDAPSALRMILPETKLGQSDTLIPAIHKTMRTYLANGVLKPAVQNGFVLTERITQSGSRLGLVGAIDLEYYDYEMGSVSPIRCTEGTIAQRVPPRVKIRAGAALELPHVMMLIDDPARTVIEPILNERDSLRMLYDFELMLGGGHLRGWAVEGSVAEQVLSAVDALNTISDGLLFAVGDGNHSLAAAKQCWVNLAAKLSPQERSIHPARYALVELVNVHSDALKFLPIHRVLFHVDPRDLIVSYRAFLSENESADTGCSVTVLAGNECQQFRSPAQEPLMLQPFLDAYLARHPQATIDYIHGESALRNLVAGKPDAVGFILQAFDKRMLFSSVRTHGALPRKSFSIGEAVEKRYYLESRRVL